MSSENAKNGSRCPNCGGKMRLVNVTRVNQFQTPEARLYDSSVARRKNLPQLSTQELMCTCCGQRAPISSGKTKRVELPKTETKIKREKKAKVKNEQKRTRKPRKDRKKVVARLLKILIPLAIIAVIAYFAYLYKDALIDFVNAFFDLIEKIRQLVAWIKDLLNK